MVNKKIILSILAIGMFAVVAAAGTYAYVQDTLTVSGSGVSTAPLATEYSTDGEEWTPFPATGVYTLTVTPASDILPTDDGVYTSLQTLMIKNADDEGTSDVYVKVIPDEGAPNLADLSFELGGTPIYTGSFEEDYLAPFMIGSLTHGEDVDLSISYLFEETDTVQNSQAGQDVGFTLMVYVVPSGGSVTEE